MNHDPACTPRIIRWPCDDRGYEHSVRAAFYRYYFAERWLGIFSCLGLPIAALAASAVWLGKGPWNVGVVLEVALVPLGVWAALTTLVYRSIHGKAARSARSALRTATEWRAQWARFEAASTRLKEYLKTAPEDVAPSTVFGLVPWLPPFHMLLTEAQDQVVARLTMSRSINAPSQLTVQSEATLASITERLWLEVLRSLASVHRNSVLGVSEMEGVRTVVSIAMHRENIQVWTLFQIHRSGTSLGCRVRTGYQAWFGGGYAVNTGRYYRGDLATLRRQVRREYVTWLGIAVMSLVPVAGWFIALVGAAVQLAAEVRRAGREFRWQEASRHFFAGVNPAWGDSLDYTILESNRQSRKYGSWYEFSLTSTSRSEIAAVRQHVLSAIANAITVCGDRPETHQTIDWSDQGSEVIVR